MDIALPTGANDELYQKSLAVGLAEVKKFEPDFILYQMGVDPLEFDQLGKMSLTYAGLMRRDGMVIDYALSSKIPISLALGGGYSKPIEKSVTALLSVNKYVNFLERYLN